MKRIKIIADNKIPFLKGALEDVADISYYPGAEIDNEIVRNADALIIRTRTVCNRKLLEGSSVRFIATATIGYDHIDTEFCRQNNITWTNAPGCNSSSVEQYVLSALLELSAIKGYDPEKMSIGIIGAGMVGSKVARVAGLLGMNVLVNDPPRERKEGGDEFTDLSRIKKEADIISFHVPLNMEGPDKTYHMADKAFFDELDKRVLFVNTSRGPVVDQEALKQAISAGRISSLVLDVWENEPDIDRELLSLCDIGTSHIAGYSTDGKANGTRMSVQALSEFFKLGKDSWEPAHLPPPESPKIVVDCTGMEKPEILQDVYTRCYDVIEDDEKLKEAPGDFEKIRGDYPVRREAGAYSVRLINNAFPELEEVLEKLGFSVLELDCFC